MSIKDFFNNKVVKGVEAGIVALGSAGLIIGGIGVTDIQTVPTLAAGVITAVEAIVLFIKAITKKEN